MEKRKALVLLGLLVGGLLLVGGARGSALQETTYTLPRQVIGGGAGPAMQGGGYTLHSTLGQTAIGWSGGNYQIGSGYWYGGAQERRIYLPLVMKDFAP